MFHVDYYAVCGKGPVAYDGDVLYTTLMYCRQVGVEAFEIRRIGLLVRLSCKSVRHTCKRVSGVASFARFCVWYHHHVCDGMSTVYIPLYV